MLGHPLQSQRHISHLPGRRGNEHVELIATNCEMCFWRCGVLAEVKDGKVLKLQGNPNHPMTKGKLCARGNAGTQLLYDPDRLKYPQVRTGSRGAGKFKRVSWDEALDQFAGKLKEIKQKYGPEAVAVFPHGVGSGFFATLMKAYGTPNAAETAFAQCFGPRDVAYLLTFGRPVGSPEPVDLEESKLIVLIGSHIGENIFTSQVTAFSEGLSRGAKLLVVDPRFSTAASKANWWLPIRPGSDIALLPGVVQCAHHGEPLRQRVLGPVRSRFQGTCRSCAGLHAGVGGIVSTGNACARDTGNGTGDTGFGISRGEMRTKLGESEMEGRDISNQIRATAPGRGQGFGHDFQPPT